MFSHGEGWVEDWWRVVGGLIEDWWRVYGIILLIISLLIKIMEGCAIITFISARGHCWRCFRVQADGRYNPRAWTQRSISYDQCRSLLSDEECACPTLSERFLSAYGFRHAETRVLWRQHMGFIPTAYGYFFAETRV